ncbi:MAG: hypothetical protein WCG07_03145 [Candidatus Taylorbacteria bacterium]
MKKTFVSRRLGRVEIVSKEKLPMGIEHELVLGIRKIFEVYESRLQQDYEAACVKSPTKNGSTMIKTSFQKVKGHGILFKVTLQLKLYFKHVGKYLVRLRNKIIDFDVFVQPIGVGNGALN